MQDRKDEHLRICIENEVEASDPGFERFGLKVLSLPEIDFSDIDTSIKFLGKKFDFPLIIEAMTGGTPQAKKINRTLAKVAQDYGIGFGVGSQRAAIKDSKLEGTYQVRDIAPDIFLIGNIGAVQFNHGYGLAECERAVSMIEADALALHINAVQEAVQPEGDLNFKGLIKKINDVSKALKTPVIAKECGFGLDLATASRLNVSAYDVGGSGGTSWSLVESYRNQMYNGPVGVTFCCEGIPTADATLALAGLKKPLISSGGIRSGLDGAKAVALGADVCGVALPFLRAYQNGGEKAIKEYLDLFIYEFKTAMFVTGASKVQELKGRFE